jgi:hypothetical protein
VVTAAVIVIAAGGLALATWASGSGQRQPQAPATLAGTPQPASSSALPRQAQQPSPAQSPVPPDGQCQPQGQGHTAAVPLCALPAGTPGVTLVIVSGVPSIAVRVAGRDDPGMQGNLVLAATAGDYGARPELGVVGGAGAGRSGQGGDAGPVVGLSLEPAGTAAGGAFAGGAALSVTLSAGVTWQLDFGGGTSQTTVDLAGGQVAALDFGQGSSQVAVTLPRPRGTVLLKLDGGASQLLVSVPAGVPARVTARDGASEVTLGGATYRGIAAGTVLTQPGYGAAAGRLDVDAASGVSQVTIAAG